MIHELKILPEYFNAVISGEKSFEIRKNDRNFNKGDYLALNEFNGGEYTGRSCLVAVDYILSDTDYVKKDMVVMAIKPCIVIPKSDIYNPATMKTDYSVPLVPRKAEICK